MKNQQLIIGLVVGVATLAGLYYYLESQKIEVPSERGAVLVAVNVPELTPVGEVGKQKFDQFCAACHGDNAAGQEGVAPPFVHPIYEPGHHGDIAFQIAAANGVQAHHWPFGNMPKVEGVTEADVTEIIAYVRELQRANGIN